MNGPALKNIVTTLMASALLTFPSTVDQLTDSRGQAHAAAKPNILFVIMDDVGIDQLATFGFGGIRPPHTPNLNRIAAEGVAFTNAWAMPECSPSRAAFFTGRYPIRTGVTSAIVQNHIPQAYVSSFEATIPRVLQTVGYTSAMVGKYHLGNENDPAGNCAPSTRGWNVFQGNMNPGPPSIDKTAGGVDPSASQVCGYFQTDASGACYVFEQGQTQCDFIRPSNAAPQTTPSRTCLQRGGIFTPNQACGANPPTRADFNTFNSYYVWPRTTETGVRPPLSTETCGRTQTERTYMTTVQSEDGAAWWNRQSGPRMLTVSYNAIHTPLQPAPTDVVPDPTNRPSTCNSGAPPRPLINSMIEGIDVELGRLLADAGLGTLRADGRTLASLNLRNTMLVIVGDNGSFGPTVRVLSGFSAGRSKGTVYQTGVWVPLLIAGSVVSAPGRKVDALVNVVDLFQLFGEAAGVNVKEVVPPSHTLDSEPLLPYLTSASTTPIRETNYAEIGPGTFTPDPDERSWPCAIGGACNDTLVPTKSLCHDNGGTWYGPEPDGQQLSSCCAVQAAVPGTTLVPLIQYSVRNRLFKLVQNMQTDCSKPLPPNATHKAFPWAEYRTKTTYELYNLKPTQANPTGLDLAQDDFLKNCPSDPSACVPDRLRSTYRSLSNELDSIKESARPANVCQSKGDGNLDMWVNERDVTDWKAFRGKGPSRYDINLDAKTNEEDLAIINANLGRDCLGLCARADLDRNGRVNQRDQNLMLENSNQPKVCDGVLCGGDLNGDGIIDIKDFRMMAKARRTCNAGETASVR